MIKEKVCVCRSSVEMSDNGTSLSQRKATEMLQAAEVMSVSKVSMFRDAVKTTSFISECNRVTDTDIFKTKMHSRISTKNVLEIGVVSLA